MNNVLKTKLENWITENIQHSSWKDHDHLHIDEISKKLENRKNWIQGGLDCLELTHEIILKSDLNFSVELAFDLYSTNQYLGINFKSLIELKKQFEDTPPSIYIYSRKNEDWNKTLSLGINVKLNDFEKKDVKILYFESKLKDYIEYARRVAFIYE